MRQRVAQLRAALQGRVGRGRAIELGQRSLQRRGGNPDGGRADTVEPLAELEGGLRTALGDRVGTRTLLVGSLLLTGLVSLACAAAPDIWTLVGASVIVASGLYIIHREHRLRLSKTAVPNAEDEELAKKL